MLYTEEDNKAWWEGMTAEERAKVFSQLLGRARSIEYKIFLKSLEKQYKQRGTLTAKQIASVRKFYGR